MKGREIETTWTVLDSTADIGATQIKLINSVDWKVGDRIVIAATSFNHYEAEERLISAITTTNGKTLITLH